MIIDFDHLKPVLGYDVFVAPDASVIGRVETGDRVSIWYGCVIINQLAVAIFE